MSITYIYTLTDPLTNEIRYVGKTTQDPQKRYKQHLNKSKKRKTYVNIWVNDLLNDGLKIVDYCEECDWIELERMWAIKLYEENKKLCNLTYIGNKEERDPNLSLNSNGVLKKDKLYKEITWLKNNTNLTTNDIILLYGKSDWKRYKKIKQSESRQNFFNIKKYKNILKVHPEIKNQNLNEMENFIWCTILHLKCSIPNQNEYMKLLKPYLKKGSEFYDKLFYNINDTSDYYISVLKEISNKLLTNITQTLKS